MAARIGTDGSDDDALRILRSLHAGLVVAVSGIGLILGILAAMFIASNIGCAITRGDPCGHPIECYEGPTIITVIPAPTPAPDDEGAKP